MGRTMFPLTSHIVGRQDNWAVRKQNETYLLPRPNSDLSSRFDKAGLRYRKIYNALVARQTSGDCSYLDDGQHYTSFLWPRGGLHADEAFPFIRRTLKHSLAS